MPSAAGSTVVTGPFNGVATFGLEANETILTSEYPACRRQCDVQGSLLWVRQAFGDLKRRRSRSTLPETVTLRAAFVSAPRSG